MLSKIRKGDPFPRVLKVYLGKLAKEYFMLHIIQYTLPCRQWSLWVSCAGPWPGAQTWTWSKRKDGFSYRSAVTLWCDTSPPSTEKSFILPLKHPQNASYSFGSSSSLPNLVQSNTWAPCFSLQHTSILPAPVQGPQGIDTFIKLEQIYRKEYLALTSKHTFRVNEETSVGCVHSHIK